MHQGSPRYSTSADDGENGGSGGDGGDGGNGGNLTIYFTDWANLNHIYVNSSVGRGGRGASAGRGGRGGNCYPSSWRDADGQYYYCSRGSNGYDGRHGDDGSSGITGTLYTINQNERLPGEILSMELDMSQMANNSYQFIMNIWDFLSGAENFLAPGSIISNNYYNFRETLYKDFQLTWNNSRSIEDFSGKHISLKATKPQINISFPSDVWIDGKYQIDGQRTNYIVNKAFLEDDARKIKYVEYLDSYRDMQIILNDESIYGDNFKTDMWLTYKCKFLGYVTAYAGPIKKELLIRDGSKYIIEIGKYPIKSKCLKPGRKIYFDARITRKFNDHETTYTVFQYFRI